MNLSDQQRELLEDKFILWDRASREGSMDQRDYNRRAADALKVALSLASEASAVTPGVREALAALGHQRVFNAIADAVWVNQTAAELQVAITISVEKFLAALTAPVGEGNRQTALDSSPASEARGT